MNISDITSNMGFKFRSPHRYQGIFITGGLEIDDYGTGFVNGHVFIKDYGNLFKQDLGETLCVTLLFNTIDDGGIFKTTKYVKDIQEGEKLLAAVLEYFSQSYILSSAFEMNKDLVKLGLYGILDLG